MTSLGIASRPHRFGPPGGRHRGGRAVAALERDGPRSRAFRVAFRARQVTKRRAARKRPVPVPHAARRGAATSAARIARGVKSLPCARDRVVFRFAIWRAGRACVRHVCIMQEALRGAANPENFKPRRSRRDRSEWIPAFAGMTGNDAGMTARCLRSLLPRERGNGGLGQAIGARGRGAAPKDCHSRESGNPGTPMKIPCQQLSIVAPAPGIGVAGAKRPRCSPWAALCRGRFYRRAGASALMQRSLWP